jgi:sterol 3beta-glucosyltransferase
MVMQRDGAILPGAAVSYDPPGSIDDLPRYGTQNHGGRILDLVAMPKALVDPDDRWGAHYRFTGFWMPQAQPEWMPPPALAAFVEAGPPPVVLTMGSMVMFDAERLVRHLREALARGGGRAVVVGGWSGIPSLPVPGDPVFAVAEAPYDWLFARASCVIHHGGCGTVAAVLRAGRPSILLPQITAQEHFGRMLRRERLAAGVFDTSLLRAADLAAAIETATTDGRYADSARRWQTIVSAEGGVEAAAGHIESHARGLTP